MPTDLATIAVDQQTATVNGPAGGDPRTAASVTQMGQPLTNRSLWVWNRLQEIIGKFAPLAANSPVAISGVDTAAETVTLTGHGLSNNDAVHLVAATGGTPPGGLAVGTQYYVIVVDADTIKFSLSSGPGVAVNITSGVTGNVYVVKNVAGDASIWATLNGILPAGTVRSMLRFISDHCAFDFSGGSANAAPFVFDDLKLSGTNRLKLASRPITRVQRGGAQYKTNSTPPGWDISPSFIGDLIYVQLVTAAELTYPLDLPDGSTFNSVTVRFQGAAGHAAFPGGAPTFPFFVLKKIDSNGVVTTFGATTTDASATAGAYETAHNLSQAGIGEVIDNSTYRYTLAFIGETGGNGIAGGLVFAVTTTCQMTSYPEY
jgi:hypothetical protein